jgi:hypothetical protein
MNPTVPDGEVIESLVQMYKDGKIGQLNTGKGFNMPIESKQSVASFYNDKQAAEAIKSYEYLLEDKQKTLDCYIQYLNTACEIGNINKIQVMDIVNKKVKPITTK